MKIINIECDFNYQIPMTDQTIFMLAVTLENGKQKYLKIGKPFNVKNFIDGLNYLESELKCPH